MDEYSGMPERVRAADNLPLQLTSFIGREREISEVEALLGGNRMLTFTGPGGSGKTRLALAVAWDVAPRFGDGVWLVELASLSNPELIPQAVASVLGVPETPGTTLVDSLCIHLASKEMLLVLDNCEHLIDSCASLAVALLRSCHGLRILATSREALGVAGEALFAVPPLTLPDPRHLPAVESLPHYEAARLFVERVRAVRPGFALTEDNAMAVAQVCYRLDGIPLAIEFAAARARVLSVEQISARLDDSFALLAGGGRTALPRQRTLRATMEWSHELLDREEQTLFRRLSVFAGGFTLGATEVVGSGEDIEEGEALDLLASLVDKSLVLVAERDGETRYRLLETVRQYGLERLDESGEAERIRRRHAEHYLSLAEEVEPDLREQGAWLLRLEAEHDNFRAALRWSLGPEATADSIELGLRIASALGQRGFWAAFGPSEGRGWLDRGLAGSNKSPGSLRAQALYEVSWLATVQGDHEETLVLLRESLDTFEEVGDLPGAANSLTLLGQMMIQGGDRERIDPLCDEAEALLRELSDEQATARLLIFLALAAWDSGNYRRTVELAEQSLALSRGLGDLYAIALCSGSLGFAVLDKGNTDSADALFAESLEALRKIQDKEGIFYCLLGMAGVAGSRGQPARVARLGGAAEALGEAFAISILPMYRRNYDNDARIASARSQLNEEAWAQAWAEGRAMTAEQAIEYALEQPAILEEPATSSAHPAGLSAREVEVLKLVAQGMTNAQIARELYISPRTVNAHLGSVYHKIGSSTRAEAARFAVEHNLL